VPDGRVSRHELPQLHLQGHDHRLHTEHGTAGYKCLRQPDKGKDGPSDGTVGQAHRIDKGESSHLD
jgi:hypothetical protein